MIINYCSYRHIYFNTDAEEEKKKEEWKKAAKKELEEWYKHHAETTSKTKATNRCVSYHNYFFKH